MAAIRLYGAVIIGRSSKGVTHNWVSRRERTRQMILD